MNQVCFGCCSLFLKGYEFSISSANLFCSSVFFSPVADSRLCDFSKNSEVGISRVRKAFNNLLLIGKVHTLLIHFMMALKISLLSP